MPNALAYLALILWPVASAVLFWRLPPGRALIASLLIAYLALPPQPAAIDLPLLPPLNKSTIPSLAALLILLVRQNGQIALLPQSRVARGLLAVLVIGPVFTVATNAEPIGFAQSYLPGLGIRDLIAILSQQVFMVLPLLLGRALLADGQSQRDLLAALLIGGLVYSLPMLVEVRLSPQLNLWIYGFFQHDFSQMMRSGGYRPLVFLYHGLWVAFLTMMCVLAAVALARADHSRRAVGMWAAAAYLLVLLVLCKSMASLVYALAFAPLIAVATAKFQIRVAALLAALAIVYPLMKGPDLVPESQILAVAEAIDSDRANSLRFRFVQERILLDRAAEKPLFGWGSWGRNHVHDPVTGTIRTVADGLWVIVIGTSGWLGFLAEFGLLAWPLFMLARSVTGNDPDRLPPFLGPCALLLGISLADLIPNATLTPLTFLLAGALLGHAEQFVRVRRDGRVPRDGGVAIRTVI